MTESWATQITMEDPSGAGFSDLHLALFQPNADLGGRTAAVAIQIPESGPDDVDVALKFAARSKARVVFVCDTREQANTIAAYAATHLPDHRRFPLERAKDGNWGLSQ